eukprot:NODE_2599_length_907_cov_563.339202.p1 GENE.NODE_2599_length_907_cov_563.339202~~NODE_2599_length_907_cov_563.339202.p1  ORF type:complete len:254 (+),score=50.25 NODE_2599_length_907_cov_563.339202:58-762(+)
MVLLAPRTRAPPSSERRASGSEWRCRGHSGRAAQRTARTREVGERTMSPRAWRLLALFAAFEGAAGYSCDTGECVNCFQCSGSCDWCDCSDTYNACCCSSPMGYYSRGTYKVKCPGSTYQDNVGQGDCKPCVNGYYNITITGASDLRDCVLAACNGTCLNGETDSTDGECVDCLEPTSVHAYMTQRSANTTFCDRIGIPSVECTWNSDDGAWHAQSLPPAGLLLLLLAAAAAGH